MKTNCLEKQDSIVVRQIKSIEFFKWLLFILNGFSLLLLAFVIPAFLKEANDIRTGKVILESEYQAEENRGNKEIDYDKLRSDSANLCINMMIIGLTVSTFCSIILVMGTYWSNYCCTFLSCLLLTLPIVTLILESRWTRTAPFKMLLIVTNSLNLSLSYAFSCLIKSYEYDRASRKSTP